MCVTCTFTGADPKAFHGDEAAANTGFDPLDGLSSIYSVSDSTISVYFADWGVQSLDGVRSEGFRAYEIAQFQKAFDLIETVTNLTFTETSILAFSDFELYLDTNEGFEYDNSLGYFYYPTGGSLAGTGVFNGALWDRSPGGDLEMGGFGFVTIVHELLHGLGLSHPHDDGGGSEIFPGVTSAFDDTGSADLNQGIYTTMTYNSGVFTNGLATGPDFSGNWGFEAGPMALDIAVLQEKYGANMSHATGNDVYNLPDANQSGTYWRSLWDAGGTDEIRYDGNRDATINLRAATLQHGEGGGGFISAADGIAGGYTIANGAVIENATGGAGDDRITGNGVGNTLTGGLGRDTLSGNKGKDLLNGMDGADLLRGGAGADTLNGAQADDRLFGGAGADRLTGGTGRDTLAGEQGADFLLGGDQNDQLNGQKGNDTLNGNAGADRLFGQLGNDRLIGAQGNDTLNGNAGRDTLSGAAGNDSLFGGFGNDVMTGGDGTDTFQFLLNNASDRITDFEVGQDKLVLNSALTGGLTDGAAVISQFADVTPTGVILDFGDGDVLALTGLTTTDGLAGSITVLA